MTKAWTIGGQAALLFGILGCSGGVASGHTQDANVVPVKIVKQGAGYQLLRGGKPFFIKGAGGDGSKALLQKVGGNSFRTWGVDRLDKDLVDAAQNGVYVTAGIWLGHKEHGFDYSNENSVKQQFETAKAAVLKYRNSANLLFWAVGNEMEGYAPTTDPKMWQAVQDIAKMIHQLDPNHPTMTVVAEIGGDKVASIHKNCPDIDVVGINSYGGITSIPNRYRAAGGVKPYVVTEFGPAGTWEVGKNSWGAAPELTSTEKGAVYAEAYAKAIKSEPLCLGSYAFTWGNKQEATATWFGMLLPDGSKLASVDAMSEAWTGKPVADPCPVIKQLAVEGPDQVKGGDTVQAKLLASATVGTPLKVEWRLFTDPVAYHVGGDAEAAPTEYSEAITSQDATHVTVKMPFKRGAYRLFVTVRNSIGGAAVGNIPLNVTETKPGPAAHGATTQLPLILEGAKPNSSFAPSGYMGNTGAIKRTQVEMTAPSGATKVSMFEYTANDNWGGVVWQSPANDWGDLAGGHDVTGATKLTFYARGEEGKEVVTFLFGLLKDKKFSDTADGKLADVVLTKGWKKYTIDLTGKNLKLIKTGFAWTLAGQGHPIKFYLDDVRFE